MTNQQTNELHVAAQADREIVTERVFNAPRGDLEVFEETPFITGMLTSINTRSKSCSCMASSAASPFSTMVAVCPALSRILRMTF